jgi:hypothetical protein
MAKIRKITLKPRQIVSITKLVDCFMSTLSGLTSTSSSASYAVQLAQKSKLNNSLDALDSAIQSGNLTGASTILSTLIKDNPQYASTSTSSSSSSTDPINTGFTTLATAISNNDTDAARTAWAQLKSDMSDAGITFKHSTDYTQQIVANVQQSVNETILSNLGIASTENSSQLVSLLSSNSSTASTDAVDSLVSNWVTYKANGGNSTPAVTVTTTAQTSTSTPTTEATLNVTA